MLYYSVLDAVPPSIFRTPCARHSSSQKHLSRTLNASIATIIFLAYLSVPVFGGVLVAVIASAIAAVQGIHNPQQVDLISNTLEPTREILNLVLRGIVIVFMSFTLIPRHLKDISPTGAAWVPGRWDAVIKGLIIGLILGVCGQTFIVVAKHYVAYRN